MLFRSRTAAAAAAGVAALLGAPDACGWTPAGDRPVSRPAEAPVATFPQAVPAPAGAPVSVARPVWPAPVAPDPVSACFGGRTAQVGTARPWTQGRAGAVRGGPRSGSRGRSGAAAWPAVGAAALGPGGRRRPAQQQRARAGGRRGRQGRTPRAGAAARGRPRRRRTPGSWWGAARGRDRSAQPGPQGRRRRAGPRRRRRRRGSAAGPGGAKSGGLLDLNLATAHDLDALPGIGPVLTDKIVSWRTEHGRFPSIDQLREVGGIGKAKYQALRSKVWV